MTVFDAFFIAVSNFIVVLRQYSQPPQPNVLLRCIIMSTRRWFHCFAMEYIYCCLMTGSQLHITEAYSKLVTVFVDVQTSSYFDNPASVKPESERVWELILKQCFKIIANFKGHAITVPKLASKKAIKKRKKFCVSFIKNSTAVHLPMADTHI